MCHSLCLWPGEGQDQCHVFLQNAGGSGKTHFLMVLSAWTGPCQIVCFLPSGGTENSWHKKTVQKHGLIFKRIQRQIRSKKLDDLQKTSIVLGLETDPWSEELVL